MDDLGVPYYAGGTTVPCRQLGDLQPDPTPQTLGSGPRPVNPRRSVAHWRRLRTFSHHTSGKAGGL